ncbi:hypothetical protein B0E37_05026 [Streptomyces sp. MH192]|nr:hypothetical protein [Streptomyces sp. MH192]MCF0098643.1 hypothetical protein [Streptomyces sp. MH191]
MLETAAVRPGGEHGEQQAPGAERAPVGQPVGERVPGGAHQDRAHHERLPVRAAVGGAEGVPGQMGGRPLQGEDDGEDEHRPACPLPHGYRPVEGEGEGEHQRGDADVEAWARVGVRRRQQTGQQVLGGHRGEVACPAGVGVARAGVDGDDERCGQAHPEDGGERGPAHRRERRPAGRSVGPQPQQEDEGGAQGGHVGGVEVGGPGERHDQDARHPVPPLPRPLADQAQQGQGEEAVEPHRVVRGVGQGPAAQGVRGAQEPGRPPRAGAQAGQQPGHGGSGARGLEEGDHVDREVDLVAREQRHQRGEGTAEVGAEVGQKAGAVPGLPVDEQSAVGPAVQQVPQVRVEGHVLVAQVVDVAGAGAEGEAAGEDVTAAEPGGGE